MISLPMYLHFYRADNETGSKSQEPLEWFERISVPESADGRS